MAERTYRWWERGIIYQIYPRSYKDSNQDGIGDLKGIIEKLDYLQALGVTAIWISPIYPSPMADFGYDVADYCDIHPMFGDLATFDQLVAEAHQHDLKVILDWVPNHTSSEHPWFLESRSSRDNPKRDWYIWKDAKPDGSRPNNWGSNFGGPAWTWDEKTGQYYFHQFDPGQPDLNWRNPEVRAAMMDTLRFWMRRGVDGFRMDVIWMVWKHPEMPDQPWIPGATGRGPNDIHGKQEQIYAWDYEGIHGVMREIRATLDEFDDRFSIGEIYMPLDKRMKYYGQGDELHMPFNFGLIADGSFTDTSAWNARNIRRIVDEYEAALPDFGWPNWVLGNHDQPRLASRLGSQAKARTAAILLLTLRGTPTIYMGEEIGMENGIIREDQIQDPQGKILGVEYTRDVCRTPMQWDTSPYAGFGQVEPWLPVHPDYSVRNVTAQSTDSQSMLQLYQALIRVRQASSALTTGRYTPLDAPEDVYAYLREDAHEAYFVALNFGAEAQQIQMPRPGTLLISSNLDRSGLVEGEITLYGDEGLLIRLR